MANSFQTHEWVNGQFRTRTVDLHELLKGAGTTDGQEETIPPPPKAPTCGILTRTIIESPVVHWILPVRLRSPHHNDVAFVGDNFVQISELRRDQQLHEVIRKNDFGSRIRNARVIGSPPENPKSEDSTADIVLGSGDDDVKIEGPKGPVSNTRGAMPTQWLVLVLECGDCVFLFVRRNEQGDLEFVSTRFESPRSRSVHPGFHLAVDPSSRYMALSCAEGLLIVYELESMATLANQYASNQPLAPVKSHRPRTIQGVIHKMEFLYPRPEDDYHTILLLIIIKNGKSRMVTYEWERGDPLSRVFFEEKQGHRLPVEHRMPLLLIPLTVRTSFFAVSQKSIVVCKDALQGPPTFESVDNEAPATTDLHHGIGEPLWTAWTRPFRRKDYYETKDNIYLAREDGAAILLEINSADILASSVRVGNFNCNISTAFTTVDDKFYDILIIGGDSGPGAIWKLPARAQIEQIGTVPNWSPAVDFITTDENTSWNPQTDAPAIALGPFNRPLIRDGLGKTDRLFSTSGRGIKGAVTEHRYGSRAEIHLDLDYGTPMRRAWTFPARLFGVADGLYTLLAVPDGSDVLHLSDDLTQASQPDSTNSGFDTSSRTLDAAQVSSLTVVQVTEKLVNIVNGKQATSHLHADLIKREGVVVEQAVIRGALIALASHSNTDFQVHLLRVDQDDIEVEKSCTVGGDVTCLGLCNIGGQPCTVVGVWHDERSSLAIYPVNDPDSAPPTLVRLGLAHGKGVAGPGADKTAVEQLTNMVVVEEGADRTVILLGTRSGHLITVKIPGEAPTDASAHTERLTEGSVDVFKVDLPSGGPAACASCDTGIMLLSGYDSSGSDRFDTVRRIWLTDSSDPAAMSPPVISVSALPHSLTGRENSVSLMMLASTRVLLVDLHLRPGPVPRSLTIGVTPTKLLYSAMLDCLVVAVRVGDCPTIKFLDPEAGRDIGQPTDKNGSQLDYIGGLGHPGDRIYGMAEWLYTKEDKTWLFIIVTTKDGRLLIVSAEKLGTGKSKYIRFWTRYKKKGFSDPIYSVAGYEENLFFCIGNQLHWETLNLAEKKLEPTKIFELDSPATSIRRVNSKLYALTLSHSLIVIDHVSQDEMTIAHSDQLKRPTVDMIDMGGPVPLDDDSPWPITLLCDRDRGFAGVWVPWDQPGKEFEMVFEGQLPSSVRRLRRGHTVPGWMWREPGPRYGTLPSTCDDAEVLGLCMDGSLQHFKLLNMEAWRFLALIQNLADASERMYPYTFKKVDSMDELDPEPTARPDSSMHIDGDMLQRCLERRALEELIYSNSNGTDLLREYLDGLDGGQWTADFQDEDGVSKYLELAYRILKSYLSPVL